jgi:hypothetical protein
MLRSAKTSGCPARKAVTQSGSESVKEFVISAAPVNGYDCYESGHKKTGFQVRQGSMKAGFVQQGLFLSAT